MAGAWTSGATAPVTVTMRPGDSHPPGCADTTRPGRCASVAAQRTRTFRPSRSRRATTWRTGYPTSDLALTSTIAAAFGVGVPAGRVGRPVRPEVAEHPEYADRDQGGQGGEAAIAIRRGRRDPRPDPVQGGRRRAGPDPGAARGWTGRGPGPPRPGPARQLAGGQPGRAAGSSGSSMVAAGAALESPPSPGAPTARR